MRPRASFQVPSLSLQDQTERLGEKTSIGSLSRFEKERIFLGHVNRFPCPSCPRSYKYREGLYKHRKYECGLEPRFKCPFCPHRCKLKENFKRHLALRHASLIGVTSEKKSSRVLISKERFFH